MQQQQQQQMRMIMAYQQHLYQLYQQQQVVMAALQQNQPVSSAHPQQVPVDSTASLLQQPFSHLLAPMESGASCEPAPADASPRKIVDEGLKSKPEIPRGFSESDTEKPKDDKDAAPARKTKGQGRSSKSSRTTDLLDVKLRLREEEFEQLSLEDQEALAKTLLKKFRKKGRVMQIIKKGN
nr:hypothetical protein BaRGS_024286 [Batillaria attramentaria]